jgi:Family of unknown function (DUF6884)
MPQCCAVMRSEMMTGDDIVEAPPSGQGARLTIVYELPRPANDVSKRSISGAISDEFAQTRETASVLADIPTSPAGTARTAVQSLVTSQTRAKFRFLVISSCTDQKAVDSPERLTLADFADRTRFASREAALQPLARPAAEMYTGQQHVLLMRGVRRLRQEFGTQAVKVLIVSAGYGLIDESRMIVPYEATFKGMHKQHALAWAAHLGIPKAVCEAISSWRLAIVMLGEDYLRVIEPPLKAAGSQRLVFLAKPTWAGRLGSAVVVPTGISQASEFGAGLVALKGRMFEIFASALIGDPALFDAVLGDSSNKTFLSALKAGGRST